MPAAAGLFLALVLAELAVRAWVPVRNVGPSWTEFHPLYYQALKKNHSSRRRSPEFETRFTTNSLGYRGPEPTGPPRDVILFLGDSFTMGYGMSDGEEYPALVGARLRQLLGDGAPGILNAGIGRGTGYWIHFLRSEAEGYRPRCVVLGACDNDPEDNLRERLFALDEDHRLVELPPPTPSRSRRLQAFLESIPFLNETYLYGLSRQIALPQQEIEEGPQRSTPQAREAGMQLSLAILKETLALCHQRGWPAVVLSTDLEEPSALRLEALVREQGFELLRVPAKSERPDLYFEVDGHWNRAGTALAAELVANWIQCELLAAPADQRSAR